MQKAVETSPALRQKLFHLAIETGKRATDYLHRGKSSSTIARAPDGDFPQAGVPSHHQHFRRTDALPDFRRRAATTEIYRFLAAAEVPIIEGYGLTEAAPIVSVNLLPGRARIGSVGQRLPSVEAKTADDGELLVRGPNVMKGYFKLDNETKEAIDAEGWLHTGDVAQIDSDGFIKITDRKKEIIVLSGGKNISPAYLETKLATDPYVSQVCVFGDRRKHLAALIVPNFENLETLLKEKGLAGKPHRGDREIERAALCLSGTIARV